MTGKQATFYWYGIKMEKTAIFYIFLFAKDTKKTDKRD